MHTGFALHSSVTRRPSRDKIVCAVLSLCLAGCGSSGESGTPANRGTLSEPAITSYTIIPTRVAPSVLCEDEIAGLGSCVGINQQPDMTNTVILLGPAPTDPNTALFIRRTGTTGTLRTAQPPADLAAIDMHSFVQLKSNSAEIGIYVNGIDRNTVIPATSVNPLYQFATTPATAGAADQRLMPWKDGIARDLELSFDLTVKTMRRANAQGFSQSHPVIELIDTVSRRNFYITVGAAAILPFPTTPETDFFGKDFGVGNAIVSTVFRDNPGFGVRLAGNALVCDSASPATSCPAAPTSFRFRLRPQDISYAIAKARTLDPLLSASSADYAIDNFSFNNEVTSEAEVGLTLNGYTLSIIRR